MIDERVIWDYFKHKKKRESTEDEEDLIDFSESKRQHIFKLRALTKKTNALLRNRDKEIIKAKAENIYNKLISKIKKIEDEYIEFRRVHDPPKDPKEWDIWGHRFEGKIPDVLLQIFDETTDSNFAKHPRYSIRGELEKEKFVGYEVYDAKNKVNCLKEIFIDYKIFNQETLEQYWEDISLCFDFFGPELRQLCSLAIEQIRQSPEFKKWGESDSFLELGFAERAMIFKKRQRLQLERNFRRFIAGVKTLKALIGEIEPESISRSDLLFGLQTLGFSNLDLICSILNFRQAPY